MIASFIDSKRAVFPSKSEAAEFKKTSRKLREDAGDDIQCRKAEAHVKGLSKPSHGTKVKIVSK